jgi:signal transduction histidine kinase
MGGEFRLMGWLNRSLPRPDFVLRLIWVALSCLVLTARAQAGSREAPLAEDSFAGGEWIWAAETRDKQTCRFWRLLEIPRGVEVRSARLRIGVDNGFRLMLDGRELGAGSDWRSLTEYDITRLLKPGSHVLAVDAFNDNREAGMMFMLVVELADGRVIRVPSDGRWRIAPEGEVGWETKRESPAHWANAVEVGSMVLQGGKMAERIPTMVVKVPPLRPLQQHFWQEAWFQVALWLTVCVTALLYLRVLAKLAVQSKAQTMLHTERARIARDIHDELGARLTELALEGEVIQTELPEGSAAGARLQALCEKARGVSGAMDEVVWMVNSRRDTLRDFSNFSCKHAQRFLSPTQIRCRLDIGADLPEMTLELPVRRNLLLGVKEALTNAVKHSRATEISLRIQRRGQAIMVAVEDNGAGFDLETADASRNGLHNMIERMREVGGKGRIITSPGSGCCVEFQIPVSKSTEPLNPKGVAGVPLAVGGKEAVQ